MNNFDPDLKSPQRRNFFSYNSFQESAWKLRLANPQTILIEAYNRPEKADINFSNIQVIWKALKGFNILGYNRKFKFLLTPALPKIP